MNIINPAEENMQRFGEKKESKRLATGLKSMEMKELEEKGTLNEELDKKVEKACGEIARRINKGSNWESAWEVVNSIYLEQPEETTE